MLVGVHGAGLANAAFMREGSTVIELLPNGFSGRRNFGASKFAFLAALGLRRTQIVAQESDARGCHQRARGLAELLRDCDVRAEWAPLRGALLAAATSPP